MKVVSRKITGRLLLATFLATDSRLPRVGLARAFSGHPLFLQVGRWVFLVGWRLKQRWCGNCGDSCYSRKGMVKHEEECKGVVNAG